MATESKVQRVGKRVGPKRVVHTGRCGHEIVRARHSGQTGRARLVWWCEECWKITEKVNP